VKQSYKIRHTQTVNGKVQAAREALGLAHTYLDEFDKEAKELFEQTVTDAQWFDIITKVYPKPEEDTKGAMTKWENKVDVLNDIYSGPTTNMVKGTAWGAYNALTERLDWYRNPRNGNAESVLAAASGFDAATNANKNKMKSIVREVAFA